MRPGLRRARNGRVHIVLQLLERLIPRERYRSAAARALELRLVRRLLVLLQVVYAIVDAFAALCGL